MEVELNTDVDVKSMFLNRYYGEVKQRALALLAARQAGLKRTGDAETEQTAPPSTAMDGERVCDMVVY